jgi:hypothetical protein
MIVLKYKFVRCRVKNIELTLFIYSMKNLAINGGSKTVERDFEWPLFDETDVNLVADIVKSGKWGNPDCGGEVPNLKKNLLLIAGPNMPLPVSMVLLHSVWR